MYEASIGRATLTHTLPELLISSQFCAGSPTGTIALGDSGGPSILRYVAVFSTGLDIDFCEHGFVQGFYNFEKGGSIPIHVGS